MIVARPSLPCFERLFSLLSKTGKHAFHRVFGSYVTFKINTVPPNVSIILLVLLDLGYLFSDQ